MGGESPTGTRLVTFYLQSIPGANRDYERRECHAIDVVPGI